jgi:hypothetical protein
VVNFLGKGKFNRRNIDGVCGTVMDVIRQFVNIQGMIFVFENLRSIHFVNSSKSINERYWKQLEQAVLLRGSNAVIS